MTHASTKDARDMSHLVYVHIKIIISIIRVSVIITSIHRLAVTSLK